MGRSRTKVGDLHGADPEHDAQSDLFRHADSKFKDDGEWQDKDKDISKTGEDAHHKLKPS